MKLADFLCMGVLAGVALTGCSDRGQTVAGSRSSPEDIARIQGAYRRTTPAAGELVLSPEGESWRVSVTAADCRIDALGPLDDRRITATVAPPANEDGAIPGDVFQNPAGALVLTVANGEARIIEETASAEACGLGSDLSGTYVRE